MSDQPSYKESVFLPKTSFPLKNNLPKKEEELLLYWQNINLWQSIRNKSKGREKFILHDGPPYANGNIHIGTALNKILKDIVNRAAQMSGYDADYIPGWDCHGLPIEWKIEEQYRKDGELDVSLLEMRADCRAYANIWLDTQREEFKRLGVLGDWDNRYATMDFASEATIFSEIGKFLLNGQLYRGLRPVMWSPVEKTALAEAEIEYQDHTSTTIWVKFPVADAGTYKVLDASVVIWTTTPWTIPCNRAVAYNSELDYVVLFVTKVTATSLAKTNERLVVAADLLQDFLANAGIEECQIIHTLTGSELVNTLCFHPLFGNDLGYAHCVPMLPADFVKSDTGTGFVHIAPDHGEEDFKLGRKFKLGTVEYVQDDGTYHSNVPLFAGIHIFKAADPVCNELIATGGLIARGTVTHSYPHSWRSKKPVIYRATPQWFVSMDGSGEIRFKALEAIEETNFIPEKGRTRLKTMVTSRPDWCISRQRSWGVPIAVFVNKVTGEPLRDSGVVERIVEVFKTEGADAWYSSPPERFLGAYYNAKDYEQVTDIVDVWFESGSTHAFVLEDRGLPAPADLYLEGSDQHRGWFQSSLLESIGSRGRAPFKAILTHGFVLDDLGRKMAKSAGNVVSPQTVWNKEGADVLRLWVAMSTVTEDLRIGPAILKQQEEIYRKIRNTLRWVLGSLDGFTESERVPDKDMPELEQWVLGRLSDLDQKIKTAVKTHDWTGVYNHIYAFCTNDLSAFYFDVRKDTIYCDNINNPKRRSVRTVLDYIQRCLTTWLAPVLVFTTEEMWQSRFNNSSVHLEDFFDVPDLWYGYSKLLSSMWVDIRRIKDTINGSLEQARKQGVIGSSLQAEVFLNLPADVAAFFIKEEWLDLSIVSQLTLSTGTEISVDVKKATGEKCARCWKILPEVGKNEDHPHLCLRCVEVVD